MLVILAQGSPALTLPTGQIAHRGGDPVEVPDRLGRELVARGDWIEFVPEPARKPVEKTPRKQSPSK